MFFNFIVSDIHHNIHLHGCKYIIQKLKRLILNGNLYPCLNDCRFCIESKEAGRALFQNFRKNMIDQQFASAKDTEEQAYELKGKYEDALKSAKDESMRIVNQAKDEAKVQAERIVKDANTQAGAMLDKAKADIRTEQENAMKAMESRVAEIALDAASKIMGEKNSSQQDLSLYDQFIKEAGDSNDGNKH